MELYQSAFISAFFVAAVSQLLLYMQLYRAESTSLRQSRKTKAEKITFGYNSLFNLCISTYLFQNLIVGKSFMGLLL
jgi:hypothetical protein